MKSMMTVGFLILVLAMGLWTVGTNVVSTFLTSYLVFSRAMPIDISTLVFGSIELIGMLGAPTGGFLAFKSGEKKWISVAFISSLILLLGIGFVESIWGLVTLILLYGYFTHSTGAAVSSLVASLTPSRRRGIGYSMYFLFQYLAEALAPFMGAYIAETSSLLYIFPFAMCMFLISVILLQLVPFEGLAHKI
jgi:MFS family permease